MKKRISCKGCIKIDKCRNFGIDVNKIDKNENYDCYNKVNYGRDNNGIWYDLNGFTK